MSITKQTGGRRRVKPDFYHLVEDVTRMLDDTMQDYERPYHPRDLAVDVIERVREDVLREVKRRVGEFK